MKTTKVMQGKPKKIAIIAGLVAGLVTGFGYAAEVSSDDAVCAVKGWISLKESLDKSSEGSPASVETYTGRSGKGKFYVVTLEGGGYVVVSGDDEVTPILAYSKSGTFEASEKNPLWCLLAGRAAIEADRLTAAATSGKRLTTSASATSGNAAKWSRLRAAGGANSGKPRLSSAPAAAPTDLRVPELLHSDWSQGRIGNWAGTDYPYCFNMYTPEINGERAVCGCVATSGAQIMRYFQYPVASVTPQTKTCEVEGVETNLTMMGGTYDWVNMPTNINSMYSQPESATLAYREAIGKLTYDVGVAVEMWYDADGSGALAFDLANALVNVFGYRKAAYFYTNGGFSTDKLKKAILPNLDAKRPCGIGIANTSTEAGHAIVADGYGYSDDTLYIHFNMGWANIYGSNAWYAPPEFDVNGVTEYDVIDEVICNIFTDTGSEFGSIASGRVLDGSGNPIAGATVTGTTTMLNGVVTNIVTTSDERGIYAILLPAVENPCTIKATTAGNVASSEVTFNIELTDISIGNTYDNDLVVDRVPVPTISPDGGSFYEGSLDVTITCPLAGATIRYTLDGTEPTASSPSVANGGTVSVTRSLTLKAKAFMDGYTESATASATFTRIVDLETPDCLLEYVQTGNNQFIDTGINAASGIKVEFNFRWLGYNNSGYNVMLGAQSPNNSFSPHLLQNRWIAYRYNNSRWYIENYATRTENIGDKQMTMDSDCVFTVSISSSGAFETVVRGAGFTEATVTRNLGSSCNVGRNLYLFANNNDGTANEFAYVRCYGVKMWQADANGDWQLVRDFRPCKRYDRAAMWDAVSGKIFFSGSGTDLTAGPVVTPEFERKAVEYVDSTGAQYINTGVCPKTGTKAEVKMRVNASPQSTMVVLGTGKHGASSRFWMPAYYGWYMYAGCGSVQCYIEYNHAGGPSPTYSKLDKQISSSETYTFTTEMTTDGKYNVTATGGIFDGGYAYRDVSVQGDFLSSPNPMYLFGANENGSLANASSIRCYSAKIWQTNGVDGTYVPLRDLTPCQKDGRAGMYDSINDEILYSGSGTDLVIGGAAVWNNTSGDGLFENPANWSTGVVPADGDSVTVNISGETTLVVTKQHALGGVSVTGSGTLAFVGDGSLSYKRLNIAFGATVVRTGTAGLIDGGLTGAGTFVLDPGAGNTLTMTKSNTGFTGEVVVKSGTVKLGNSTSFGPINRASSIRVKGGATLDEADATDGKYGEAGTEKNKVILEEGARFVHSGSNTDDKTYPVTRLTLEGNATVDTSIKDVAIGLHYHDWYSHIDLGTNTLTVTGGKIFRISVCEISGSGTIDIQSGTKVYSTHEYDTTATVTTCNDGTINIREAATWHLYRYAVNGGRDGNLSVKNLVLDGAVTREQPASTLTVTGSITGKGTTPMLTMAEGAVFKPNGTGYLTVTESLSGSMTIDASGLDLASTYATIPLFKVGSAEMLSGVSVDFVAGTRPKGWAIVKTADGLGYDLARSGFSIIVR